MYIPPLGNAIDFDFTAGYAPPVGNALDLDFGATATAGRRRFFLGAS